MATSSKHPWRKGYRGIQEWLRGPQPAILPAEGGLVESNGHQVPLAASQEAQEPHHGPPERILCFPASLMQDRQEFSPGPFSAFRTDFHEMAGRLFPQGIQVGDFRERTRTGPFALENDPAWKQVVAVVVPWHAETRQVWTYRRGGTEARLDGKLSCLLAGHVNINDAWPGVPSDEARARERPADPIDCITRGAVRDMGEEVGDWETRFRKGDSNFRLISCGVVNDQHDAVGLVHFGFVFRLDCGKLAIPMKFAADVGVARGWMPAEHLVNDPSLGAESWTLMVARHLHENSPVRSWL